MTFDPSQPIVAGDNDDEKYLAIDFSLPPVDEWIPVVPNQTYERKTMDTELLMKCGHERGDGQACGVRTTRMFPIGGDTWIPVCTEHQDRYNHVIPIPQPGVPTETEAYKIRVRNKAIDVAEQQSWCREGLNEALRSLDLEEYDGKREVTILVQVTGTVQDTPVDRVGRHVVRRVRSAEFADLGLSDVTVSRGVDDLPH